jgi:hypothetical protein
MLAIFRTADRCDLSFDDPSESFAFGFCPCLKNAACRLGRLELTPKSLIDGAAAAMTWVVFFCLGGVFAATRFPGVPSTFNPFA